MFMLMFIGLHDDAFFCITMTTTSITTSSISITISIIPFIHDVQRIHARKHGNGGTNGHVFDCRNGRDKLVPGVSQELQQVLSCKVHVV